MKPKSFITLLAAAVILGSIIGGALAGGIAIGRDQGKQASSQELLSQLSQSTSTNGQGNVQLPGNFTGIPSGIGATMGTVEKVEGNVVTLNTRTGTVLVNIGTSTSIQKTVEGSLADISIDKNIAVSGDKNEDGSIDAKSISITSGFTLPPFGGAGPDL